MPLYPIAFEQFDFSGYDLVVSHTTRFAKSVITRPGTTHISYCHTPPRFLWNFSGEAHSKLVSPYLSFLRIYDQISAKRVDLFFAGSENAKERIKKVYGSDSKVCYPFVDLEGYGKIESFDGGYFLIIARLNKYKRIDIATDVFSRNGLKLKIVGTGPELGNLKKKAKGNIEFLGGVSEDVLKNLIAGCRGLIVTAEEDFGLTPLEAQTLGKGVIAFGRGGALETIIGGKTGIFFKEQTQEGLEEALEEFLKMRINPEDCRENARKFSRQVFQERFMGLLKNSWGS